MNRKKSANRMHRGVVRRGATSAIEATEPDSLHKKRKLVAKLCQLIGESLPDAKSHHDRPLSIAPADGSPMPALSPRMRQTLERLLLGDSEKQVAICLGVSRHTVHVYVKALYKGFGVCSRGELLARFVQAPRATD